MHYELCDTADTEAGCDTTATPRRSPLRVTHVVLSLEIGGSERNVVNQVRLGSRVGQSVSVVCIEGPGRMASDIESFGAQLISLNKLPGIKLGLISRLRTALKELRPDIVHTHQIGGLFYTGFASMGLGCKIVHTEHGREPYTHVARRRWLGRISGISVDRFFCLTQELASDVVANRIVPKRKVHRIMNGIDTSRYLVHDVAINVRQSLGIAEDALIIGTVGRLARVKRQDLLIRAFAEVKEKHANAHLLVVGEGPLKAELIALSMGLGLGNSIHFVGHQDATVPYYRAMDAFALTSESEGTPQAVLEACVAGLPVVASNVGGLSEVVVDGSTGILFPSGDKIALTAALIGVLRDREYASQLGAMASARVCSIYDIERMAREYHRHFLELLAR